MGVRPRPCRALGWGLSRWPPGLSCPGSAGLPPEVSSPVASLSWSRAGSVCREASEASDGVGDSCGCRPQFRRVM